MLMSKHQLKDFICHSKLLDKVVHTFSDVNEINLEAYYGNRITVYIKHQI